MKKLLTIVITGLLSLLVFFITPATDLPTKPEQIIDYEVRKLDVSRFDENGLLISQVHTPYLKHNQTLKQHFLTTPHIKLLQPDNTEWTITSKVANSIHDGKLISFDDNVIVEQRSPQTEIITILTTSHLLYDPKNEIASTDTSVHIQQGNNQIDASGMKVTMKDKHIELLGKARGYYEPTKAS